jgi:hypothetical protein
VGILISIEQSESAAVRVEGRELFAKYMQKIAMRRTTLLHVLLLLAFTLPLYAQSSGRAVEREQSTFGGEEVQGVPFIKHRVTIPAAVLEILKQDGTVKGCLRDNEPTADKPFASWFVASEIHLDGRDERDLVVLPNPRWQPGYGCFYSASGIQWFWIFRRTAAQYQLVLTTPGNGISILQGTHAGHRDIQSVIVGSAGRFITTVTYRFDGNRYQEFDEETKESQ